MFDQAVLGRQEAALDAALGLRRIRRDPAAAQFAQAASDLGQAIRGDTFWLAFSGARRHAEHRIAIRVDVHHPAILLQVLPQHTHVVRCRIALYESAPTPTRRVVDHAHQVAYRSSSFQPFVLRRLGWDQFAKSASTGPPKMHLSYPLRLALPQS